MSIATRRSRDRKKARGRLARLAVFGLIIAAIIGCVVGSQSAHSTKSLWSSSASFLSDNAVGMAATTQESVGMANKEEEEAEISPWVYVGEVVVVIVLSLAFEYVQESIRERLEEEGKETMIQMMDTLFREIMILGFIGLFVFICTKTGIAKGISRSIIGGPEGGEDPLSESFEAIHMIIFCVMLVFIFQCVTLMYSAERITRKWDQWEAMPEMGRGAEDSLERRLVDHGFLDVQGNAVTPLVFPNKWYSSVMHDELRDIVTWRLIRHEFLFPSHAHGQQVHLMSQIHEVRDPIVFDFERYLSEKLGEGFVELVEVDMATWIIAVLFTPCIAWVLACGTPVRIAMICCFSWVLFLGMFSFYVHISDVMEALAPGIPSKAKDLLAMLSGTSLASFQRSSGHRSKNGHSSDGSPVRVDAPDIPEASDSSGSLGEPLMKEKSKLYSWVPRFRQTHDYFKPELQRKPVMKLICQHTHRVPNAQERLMWFEEYSEALFSHMLEIVMFFQAVVTSSLLVLLAVGDPMSWNPISWVCYVFSWLEWGLMTKYLVPRVMSRLTLVTSIEYLKDPELIEKVTFEVKRERLAQALKVLTIVKLEGKARRLAAEGQETISDEEYDTALSTFEELSESERTRIETTFMTFDEDQSGTIDCQEMEGVMNAMGVVAGTEASRAACALLRMVDKDGSGQLDVEEFKVLMVLALVKSDPDEEEHDLEAFFDKIDADKSGSVSLDELSVVFTGLGVSMSPEEVGRLVYECFDQVKTDLREHDFVKWMHYLERMGGGHANEGHEGGHGSSKHSSKGESRKRNECSRTAAMQYDGFRSHGRSMVL